MTRDDADGTSDALWDARDVARYIKASRSLVYRLAEEARIPCVRIGGLLRFDPARVKTWAHGAPADDECPTTPLHARRSALPPKQG